MNKTEATPIPCPEDKPWKVDDFDDTIVMTSYNAIACRAEYKCDAELIVQAVNNYDRLVDALDASVKVMRLANVAAPVMISRFEQLLNDIKK